MGSNFRAYGGVRVVGSTTVQEERTPGGKRRWRVVVGSANFLLDYDQLFDLAEAVDETCDAVEDEKQHQSA